MLRIGLTGGIGAGKSTVAGRLRELGATIIDADLLAREVVEPGTAGLAAVVEAFGQQVLLEDGQLNRPALGKLIFADVQQRLRLNGILHPLIAERSQQLVASAAPDSVLVHDIPLLVESQATGGFDLVIVVSAPPEQRLRRLVEDRGMGEDDALARIMAQASDDERRAVADVWIDNSGSRAATFAQVDAAWRERIEPARHP